MDPDNEFEIVSSDSDTDVEDIVEETEETDEDMPPQDHGEPEIPTVVEDSVRDSVIETQWRGPETSAEETTYEGDGFIFGVDFGRFGQRMKSAFTRRTFTGCIIGLCTVVALAILL